MKPTTLAIHELRPPALPRVGEPLAEVLQELEGAILLLSPGLDAIRLANRSAVDALRALGGGSGEVPSALGVAIRLGLELAGSGQRFTPAGGLTARTGSTYRVRIKRLQSGRVLVMLDAEIRHHDPAQVLVSRFGLSHRDGRLAGLIRAGHSNAAIAAELGLRVGTVKQYVKDLFAAIGVHTRGQLVALLEELEAGTGTPKD